MKKTAAFAAALFLFISPPAFTEVCDIPPAKETELLLEFINDSGSEIKEIFISETGREAWSENLIGDGALKGGESIGLYIKRDTMLGLADIKIVYVSGKERIWKKLPVLEIFEITHKEDGSPRYERIKLGA